MTETTTQSAPTGDPPAAPPVAAQLAPAARSGGVSNGAFFAGILAVVALIAAGYSIYLQTYAHQNLVQGYYVLDMPKLLGAKMAQVMDTPGVDANAEAAKLMADLGRVLQEYGQSGILVLKKEAVMSVTADQEVTEAVAVKLGIDLTKNPQEVARRLADHALGRLVGGTGSVGVGAAPSAAAPRAPVLPPAASAPPVGASAPPVAGAPAAANPYAALPPEANELFDPKPRRQ